MARQISLVVNPTARRGRGAATLAAVEARLRASGAQLETLRSTSWSHAEQLMAAAVRRGVDVLAVMGGDGMMHLGLNACADAGGLGRTALGMIPAGTGNDLARGVGLDPEDTLAAADVVAADHRGALDLIRAGDRYVGAVLATGFDARVNERANAMRWPRGSLRYTVAALAELGVFRPLTYRLTLDGVVREQPAMLVAVGNTTTYGGGLRICPRADPTDGLLDVTVVHPVSRLKLLQLLPQMRSGRFARDPCVEQLRVRAVTVAGEGLVGYGDGERLGATPIEVTVAPRALPLVVAAAR
ncbi:diacylglycerol/lipid kinase family protein [uncultured Friedmanniella sp.]|uniref:diacylglycerol/lipid kinase family protein n=1 Tax=uncultured Friedmanniella sp. TaxID=335381 RepID=UPI0035CC0E48